MSEEENFLKAIEQLRKTEKKRKFDQSIDLIVNLKEFDVRRSSFNIFIQLPNKIKDKKIAAFFEKENNLVNAIKKEDFVKYKEKKDIKKLLRDYDFFIANAKLMPAIATTFGRILGPAGKMPSPQLGILPNEDEKLVQGIINKINSTVRLRVKEPSIKIGIGKESLTDEQLRENALAAYHRILENLPKKKDNVRNVKLKLSMDKPVDVEI
jgi:large subunit ribosomal protein L1